MAVAHVVAWGLAGLAVAGSFAWPGGPRGSDPELEPLARELAAPDDGTRVRAVLALAGADDDHARAMLVPMLRDRDPSVRETAGRLLARRGAAEALEAATGWVAGTAARDRLIGLHVLREAPELPPPARRAAERALRDGDLATRGQALDVLASHEPAASFAVVLAALGDEHRDVRARAARVLGETRDPRAAVPLIARLEDGDRQVRAESITALGALGAAGERRVVPALLRQLDEGTPDLRLPAIDALGAVGDPAPVPALVRLARRRPRDELTRHAILALGTLATPEALETVRALARDPETLNDAREALARAGARALPVLQADLLGRTPNGAGAAMAADLLGALGDRHATPWLAAAVEAGGPAAVAAAASLARLGDDAAVPALLRTALARTTGVELRVAALDALATLEDDRAAEGIEKLIPSPEVAVRVAAARAAATCGGPSLAPALAARLSDGDARVRREAARSLALLAAPSSEVTRAIVTALARGPLARDTPDEGVGVAVGDALEQSARPSDAAFIEQAFLTAKGSARAPLARALAAVHAQDALTSRPVIDALIKEVVEPGGDDGPAMAAADALATARLARDHEEVLTAAFARAEPGVAARLSPAVARFHAGARQLAATLADAEAGATRRAAAAWALAGVPEGAAALRAALAAPEVSVAANARAALASPARLPGQGWAAVRLVTATGEPWPRQWVTVTPAGGAPVWTVTDLDGRARLSIPATALTLTIP